MPEDVEHTEEVEQEVDDFQAGGDRINPVPAEPAALQAERDELVDTLQRVQAEFDNYRGGRRATSRAWLRAPTSGW